MPPGPLAVLMTTLSQSSLRTARQQGHQHEGVRGSANLAQALKQSTAAVNVRSEHELRILLERDMWHVPGQCSRLTQWIEACTAILLSLCRAAPTELEEP